MDAIRKKMQSMKAETDDLYSKIKEYEDATKEANSKSDANEALIRDMGKKVQKYETKMEETMEQLTASSSKMDAAESEFKDKEEDVNAQSRRVLLLEQESTISVEKLATTVMKLALMSKEADGIVKDCTHGSDACQNGPHNGLHSGRSPTPRSALPQSTRSLSVRAQTIATCSANKRPLANDASEKPRTCT